MKNKKGISLIVLVITIIVMIILAAAIIITLNNNGIINKSNEAVFKQNVKNYQAELSLYLSDILAVNPKFDIKTVNASSTTTPSIKDVIKSMKDVDLAEFEVSVGELKYIGNDANKIAWSEQLGIKTKNTPMTEEEYINFVAKTGGIIVTEYTDDEGNKQSALSDDGKTFKTGYNAVTDEIVAIPYGVTTLGEGALFYCSQIKQVILPPTLTTIKDAAFESCNSLTTINIPKSLTTVGKGQYGTMFDTCQLTNVTLEDGLTTIPDNMFCGAGELTSITIPNTVTTIGKQAFYLTGLETITIPSSVKSIGDGAFGVSPLKSVYIPASTTTWGDQVFEQCNLLETAVFADGVTKIPEGLFAGCTKLANVTLPTNNVTFGDSAFSNTKYGGYDEYGNKGDNSYTVPQNVTDIGNNNIASILYKLHGTTTHYTGQPSWGYKIYEFPEGTTTIPSLNYITKYIIPASVTSVENGFYDCYQTGCRYIYFRGTQEQWDSLITDSYFKEQLVNYGVTVEFNFTGTYEDID